MRFAAFFLFIFLRVGEASASICLNMIVKNEAQVIEACLNSVKPLIDYWVIVDTGSTDQTREKIKKCMEGIPGELHERPWVNFSQNRNEALRLAKNKGDYVLLIDADEVLQFSENFSLPTLDKDLYFILVRQIGAADAKRNGLINNHLNWEWKGVLHEVITCPEAKSSTVLEGLINLCNTHGEQASGRSQKDNADKYLRDAATLEAALKAEPNNSRYVYYLGISYAAANQYELAKKSFERRVSMSSADVQETFLALYNQGLMQDKLNEWDAALETFFKAYEFRPTRGEPLYQAAKIYRKKGNILLGYLLAKHALSHSYPKGDSCVEYVAYDHAMLIEFANCALLLGKFQEGLEVCSKLLANPNLPSQYKPQVLANYELAFKKVAPLSL
jgi:glycosyltransferase involved in cell wall biosynthesis